MTWAAALFLVLTFLGLVARLGIPARAGDAVARTQRAVADLRNRDLSELDKEKATRAHASALFGLFLLITLLSAVALLLPLGAVWLVAAAGLCDFQAVLDATLSWPILLGATFAGIALLLRRRR
ncbi:MAG TPA: hypothetical protein VFZ65_00965 [Planctomycetota bacterium]|nr:hypothetical protein [Planctomycetota bacterium]